MRLCHFAIRSIATYNDRSLLTRADKKWKVIIGPLIVIFLPLKKIDKGSWNKVRRGGGFIPCVAVIEF